MNEHKYYDKCLNDVIASVGKDRLDKLFEYEYCELESRFLGFLDNYADLKDLPKDFTIIDIGAYQGVQADFFKEHLKYISVEPDVPVEYRLQQDNAEYYEQTAQEFMRDTLPRLIDEGLDPEKTFAVCSAVPDFEATKQVAATFQFYRVAYPATKTLASYPDDFIPTGKFAENRSAERIAPDLSAFKKIKNERE